MYDDTEVWTKGEWHGLTGITIGIETTEISETTEIDAWFTCWNDLIGLTTDSTGIIIGVEIEESVAVERFTEEIAETEEVVTEEELIAVSREDTCSRQDTDSIGNTGSIEDTGSRELIGSTSSTCERKFSRSESIDAVVVVTVDCIEVGSELISPTGTDVSIIGILKMV